VFWQNLRRERRALHDECRRPALNRRAFFVIAGSIFRIVIVASRGWVIPPRPAHRHRARTAIKGGKFDETGAENALRYFRRLARGGRDTAREQERAHAFIYNHGQSFDWIVYGNARGMI
jgi:hypothetical protein